MRLEDQEEKELMDNAGLLGESDLSEDEKIPDGKDKESSGGSEDEGEDTEAKSLFVNPLAKKVEVKANESEEWSDDDLSEGTRKAKQLKKKKGKKEKDAVLGKRKRKGSFDNVADFFLTEKIEEVPLDDPMTKQHDGYVSMDSDDIAETRILARKMLRKKARNEIIDSSYNRFNSHEEPSSLPTWFVDDEARHRFCDRLQPTKEEVAIEKAELKEYNARPSKKVEQAKARKKKRLVKAMQKIKKKAQVIADQDLNEASKMKQIQKLYRKEKDKHKETTSYVVNRTFQATGPKKGGRLTKHVD